MALPALPTDDVLAMGAKRRHEYFEQYARFIEDAPDNRYAIRVGTTTLFSDDLRQKLERFVRNCRRRKARGK